MVKIKKNLTQILEDDPPYLVYVLKCEEPDHFYVGYTSDLERRVKEHESGNGAEFTSEYGVDKVIYLEPHKDEDRARKRETLVTLECMYHLRDMDKVGGGKYSGVIKPLSQRREIERILKNYAKKVGE